MQKKDIETALKKNKNTFSPIGNADVVKRISMMETRPTTYRCGDKYGPGNQCKRKQQNCLIGELEPNQVVEEANAEVEDIAHNIIIEGIVKNRNLAILVDFGITYNFIDKSVVKETGQKVSYCPPDIPHFIPLGGCDIVLCNDCITNSQ
ncbi:hypothetical protein KY289_030699 [Solanum tuberosum]|nr:hypothetical protein KY289_030699 [Solanum tuberosum]